MSCHFANEIMFCAAMATSCASCVANLRIYRDFPKLPNACTRFRCCFPASDDDEEASFPVRCPSSSQALISYERLAGLQISRRELAGHLLFSTLALPSLPALADVDGKKSEFPENYTQYINDDDYYSLLIPTDWIKGTGNATGKRPVTAFYPVDDTSASVNVLITSVGADYTSMRSFGSIDAFAETLVNSLDRSWKRPPGQAAKLVDSKLKKGLYYVEYTIQQPGEKKKHLLSVIGMRFNGWYNNLYTVTGQYLEDDEAKYGPLLQKVVDSFKFA